MSEQAQFHHIAAPDSRVLGAGWLAVIMVALTLCVANLYLGALNQDEGWYLYSARLVSEGKLPFVDFASTQGPVMAIVYSLGQPLVNAMGVAGGRLYTAMLGMFCFVIVAVLAYRHAPKSSAGSCALMAFTLAAVNVYQSYFFTIVKTYALAGSLIAAGFLMLSIRSGTWVGLRLFAAGLFFAMAAATRISAGVIIPIIFLLLLTESLQMKKARAHAYYILFAVGALTGLAVFLFPFWFLAPDAFRFGMFEYHSARSVGGLAQVLAYKAGFISRTVQAYFAGIGLLTVIFIMDKCTPLSSSIIPKCELMFTRTVTRGLWYSILAVTVIHFAAPFPYDDYQAMIYPVFAVALAVYSMKVLEGYAMPYRQSLLLSMTIIICILASFSSPVNEKWFVGERDRIWWPIKKESSLVNLHKAAVMTRSLAQESRELFTQDTYLAVESGMKVPHGMEMGPFCYYPDWPTSRAVQCHVLNREMMVDTILNSPATVAAVSGYGFAVKAPAIMPLESRDVSLLWKTLLSKYQLFRTVDGYGQAGTKLDILLKK